MLNFACDEIEESLDKILDYYYSKGKESYIPALIDEGNLFANDYTDLYVKLIAINKSKKINRTWLVNNLIIDNIDGINFIVSSKYKYNIIYDLNPIVFNTNEMTYIEQNSSRVFDIEYFGDKTAKKYKVLSEDDNNILLYLPAIRDYAFTPEYCSDKFDLYIELEYRSLINGLHLDKKGDFEVKDGFVDLVYQNNDIIMTTSEHKMLYSLRATIKIDPGKFFRNKNTFEDRIKVIELGRNEARLLNTSNYNDDTNAGLVVFSDRCVPIIKKYYYFYDLNLVPKIQGIDGCLVDYLDDIIVFWEGEFNSHIPNELKNELINYNISNRFSNIMSKAMYDWQLMGKWEIFDELLPNQKLASIIEQKYKNTAFENGIDFYPPTNKNEFSDFLTKLFRITNLSVRNLNFTKDKERYVNEIMNGKVEFDNEDDLKHDYQIICYAFTKVLGYDKG